MLVAVIKTIAIFIAVINLVPLLIWLERKGAAYIQDRRGPNRAAIAGIRLGGIIHSLSDVVKLLTKEDIIPPHVNKPLYILAPMIAMFVATITVAVVPFAAPIVWEGNRILLQVADLDVGLLYVFAVSSLGIYGVMLAGWAANNKYSLLGGLRSSAQMISYEVSMGLAVIGIFLLAGSLKLTDIVYFQGSNPFHWNIFLQPIGFILFLTAVFAETNRLPFDLPEGESELVAGFHVEYSSMKFALFFMAEYAHMVVASTIIVTLFFGGWQIPFLPEGVLQEKASQILSGGWLIGSIVSIFLGYWLTRWYRKGKYGDLRDYEPLLFGVLAIGVGILLFIAWFIFGQGLELGELGRQLTVTGIQLISFLTKVLFFCFFFIWIRWTLPRLRYDQLMKLGWKIMLPVALLNVLITGAIALLI